LPTDYNTYNGSRLAEEMMENMNDGLCDAQKNNLSLIWSIIMLKINVNYKL
jgi:hypothetical protein